MAKYQPKTKEELKALCDDLSVNLGDIDTSLITDMSELFLNSIRGRADFSGVEKWDVSNVINMNQMFSGSHFSGSIKQWNVGKLATAFQFFGCEDLELTKHLKKILGANGLHHFFWIYFNEDTCSYCMAPKKINRVIGIDDCMLVKRQYGNALIDAVGQAIFRLTNSERQELFSI